MIQKDNHQAKVWIIDESTEDIALLHSYLEEASLDCTIYTHGEKALKHLSKHPPDIILLAVRLPQMDGFDVCKLIHNQPSGINIPIIFLTASDSLEAKMHGFKLGAVDYITKPFYKEEVLARVNTHLNLKRLMWESQTQKQTIQNQADRIKSRSSEIKTLKKILSDIERNQYDMDGIIGKSKAIQHVTRLIRIAAEQDVNILITGETGTGKELIARSLHKHSKHWKQRFVAINCSAIPEHLIESELFGYEKGAFTGAVHQKIGTFEYASNGTLFLDEIGDLPLNLQSKLLRVLQERTITRVGGNDPIPINVRLITATHQDLHRMIQEGKFREDLFYRLNVIPIYIPPLRDRKEDIILLAMHFIQKYNHMYNKDIRRMSESFYSFLLSQPWHGNVRELENTIERYVVLCQSTLLKQEEVLVDPQSHDSSQKYNYEYKISLKENIEAFERSIIIDSLTRNYGNMQDTAHELKIDPKTLYRRMNKYHIDKREMKV